MSKQKKNVFEQGVETYSINLLWINAVENADQEYIYPVEDREALIQNLNVSLSWAKQNTKANIKIWYDSKLVTSAAVTNTEQALDQLLQDNECNNITLHDIREIEFVDNNEVLFTQKIGVYFRVDYLKLIILAHELAVRGVDGAVFADLQYRDSSYSDKSDKIFSEAELFDLPTMEKLEKYGIVVGNGNGAPENQFIQAVNDKLTVDVLRHIVNVDALRAINVFNASDKIQLNFLKQLYIIPFASTIYETSKLYMGLKTGSIKANKGFIENKVPDGNWIDYKPEEHGYDSLGNSVNIRDLNFVYTDFQAEPLIGFRSSEIINHGFTNDDCHGVRGYSRGGNSHWKEMPVLKEHEPFIPHYWLVESHDSYEVEPLGID
jgi:hypothetical protein